jgi:hypothetical protein
MGSSKATKSQSGNLDPPPRGAVRIAQLVQRDGFVLLPFLLSEYARRRWYSTIGRCSDPPVQSIAIKKIAG